MTMVEIAALVLGAVLSGVVIGMFVMAALTVAADRSDEDE